MLNQVQFLVLHFTFSDMLLVPGIMSKILSYAAVAWWLLPHIPWSTVKYTTPPPMPTLVANLKQKWGSN